MCYFYVCSRCKLHGIIDRSSQYGPYYSLIIEFDPMHTILLESIRDEEMPIVLKLTHRSYHLLDRIWFVDRTAANMNIWLWVHFDRAESMLIATTATLIHSQCCECFCSFHCFFFHALSNFWFRITAVCSECYLLTPPIYSIFWMFDFFPFKFLCQQKFISIRICDYLLCAIGNSSTLFYLLLCVTRF